MAFGVAYEAEGVGVVGERHRTLLSGMIFFSTVVTVIWRRLIFRAITHLMAWLSAFQTVQSLVGGTGGVSSTTLESILGF